MNTPFLQVMLAVIAKDFRAELRSRELIGTMLMFAVLSILVFSFALELDRIARQEAVSGVLWVTLVFASILGLNRSMSMERENASIEALLLAPVSRAALFAGKFIGNFVFTLIIGLFLLPLMTVLYNMPLVSGWMFVVMAGGIFGFASTGTLLAAMTVQTRAREALLPIALLPVALPLLLSAVKASTAIISDAAFDTWATWLQIIIVVDIVYTVVALLGFGFVVEE